MTLGGYADIDAAGLQPGTTYTINADHGRGGTASDTFTQQADSTTHRSRLSLPSNAPVDKVHVSLTAGHDPTVLASMDLAVLPATLTTGFIQPEVFQYRWLVAPDRLRRLAQRLDVQIAQRIGLVAVYGSISNNL